MPASAPTKPARDDANRGRDDADLIRDAFADADAWLGVAPPAQTGIPSGSSAANANAPAGAPVGRIPAGIAGIGILSVSSTLPHAPGFRLIRETHRGGQGIVYEAAQLSTDRIVAVKFMLGGPLAGPIDRTRFDREVRILARLQHPGIVNIYDTGVAAGCRYFVMDYIAGQPIDEYVQSARLGVRATLELFARVCDIVFAAHVRGFIHRDLKPSHILIDDDGQPHIVDFGLGKIIDPDDVPADAPVGRMREDDTSAAATTAGPGIPSLGVAPVFNRCPDAGNGMPPLAETGIPSGSSSPDRTATGQFIGSLAWASPEQAKGRHDDLDTRTDVYSLGVILYYILTERFPYSVEGDPRAVLDRIIHDAPIRCGAAAKCGAAAPGCHEVPSDPRVGRRVLQSAALSFLNPLIPQSLNPSWNDEVDSILLKCLSKSPARRYQSAGDLAAELRRYLAGDPIEAKRDNRWYVLRKALRRHSAPAAIAAAFLLLILCGTVVSTVFWQRAENQRALAETSAAHAKSEAAKQHAVNQIVQDMLAKADRSEQEGNPNLTVREVMDTAARELEAGTTRYEPQVEAAVHNTIGITYRALGQFERSETHLRKALDLRRSVFGSEHTEMAESLSELAKVLDAVGDVASAERLHREALAMRRKLRGDRHPDVAESLNNLATTLHQSGDYAAAEKLYRESLTTRREADAEDHPGVAVTLGNLAQLLTARGEFSAAESMEREALALSRKLLGDEHPSIATHLLGLADLSQRTGDYATAEPLYHEPPGAEAQTSR